MILGHHWVWKTFQILHRDISHENIMFYRKDEKVVSVLTDWDLAEEQEDDGTDVKDLERSRRAEHMKKSGSEHQAFHSTEDERDTEAGTEEPELSDSVEMKKLKKPRYRTGTGPFMAWDLMQTGPTPAHLYRHDLESFLWVLAWFCAVFDPVKHEVGVMPAWHQRNLVDIGAAKGLFLTHAAQYNQVFSKTHTDYLAFVTRNQVIDLRSLFADAREASERERRHTEDYFFIIEVESGIDEHHAQRALS